MLGDAGRSSSFRLFFMDDSMKFNEKFQPESFILNFILGKVHS